MWEIFAVGVATIVATLVFKLPSRQRPNKLADHDSLLHHGHVAVCSLISRGNVPAEVAELALKINRLGPDPGLSEFIVARAHRKHGSEASELEQAVKRLEAPDLDAVARCMTYGLLASAAAHPHRGEELLAQLRERLFHTRPGEVGLSESQITTIGLHITEYYDSSILAA